MLLGTRPSLSSRLRPSSCSTCWAPSPPSRSPSKISPYTATCKSPGNRSYHRPSGNHRPPWCRPRPHRRSARTASWPHNHCTIVAGGRPRVCRVLRRTQARVNQRMTEVGGRRTTRTTRGRGLAWGGILLTSLYWACPCTATSLSPSVRKEGSVLVGLIGESLSRVTCQ